MRKVIYIVLISFLLCVSAQAAEKQVSATWAYNGTNTDGGFRLYLQAPGAGEAAMVADIPGVEVRTWTGAVDILSGRNVFTLTAYEGDSESVPSSEFPFEYLNIPALPPPTMVIQFTQ